MNATLTGPRRTSYGTEKPYRMKPSEERQLPPLPEHISGGYLNDPQSRQEYFFLLHYAQENLPAILASAQLGQPLAFQTTDKKQLQFPTSLKHGSTNEIVTIEGQFGVIHLLLPKPKPSSQ